MNIAPIELETLLSDANFVGSHGDCGAEFSENLRRFLHSSMDEVRTIVSSKVALSILDTIGISDFGQFREIVLRRELHRAIAYPKQRDHSSHTIYNYLLGWYFYSHCKELRESLDAEFAKRGVSEFADWPFNSACRYFGCVWQYASILHDVGYMFEGGILTSDFQNSVEQAEIGARVVRDYFNRQLWIDYDIDSFAARAKFISILTNRVDPPKFRNLDSLGEIADELRDLGDLDLLLTYVRGEFEGKDSPIGPVLSNFSGDAFELWIDHYERFQHLEMCKRINCVRQVFNGLIDKGLPGLGVRLLEPRCVRGAASVARHHLLLPNLCRCSAVWIAAALFQLIGFFRTGNGSPKFWWTGIVWATAAVAIHNIQQMSKVGALAGNWPGPLSIEEDPLSYLGVLVDVLQEWDRYSVFKDLDREPVQGSEVDLGNDRGRVTMTFTGPAAASRSEKARIDLNIALVDWERFVELSP